MSRPVSSMRPWLATHTTASARRSVTGCSRAASASSRDAGGAGNAAPAESVSASATFRSRIRDMDGNPMKKAIRSLMIALLALPLALQAADDAAVALDPVFKHYTEALRLAPKHRGAHEYIGEAYLMVGNVPKAREHLTQLDRLCFFGCEEYSSLKKAIRESEAKGAR